MDHHLPHKFLWSIALWMRLYEGAEINRLNHKMYYIPSFSEMLHFMLGCENEAQLFQIFLDLNILDYEYINSPLILFAITNIDTLEKMQPKFRKSQLADWEGEISSIISPQVCLLQNIFSISQHMPHLCIPLLRKASKNGNGGFCVLQSTSIKCLTKGP